MTIPNVSKGIKDKADRYLTEGRVAAISIDARHGSFLVAGSGDEPYKVRYLGEWFCSCPSQVMVCAHIWACQKITNLEPSRRVMFSDDPDDLVTFLHANTKPKD